MTIWFLGSPSFVIIRVYSWLKNCGWISPRLFGLTLLAALPLQAQDTLQDLLDADQLRITARLDPTEPVIATQRAKLVVEIATPNWFTGGTQLSDVQVRNAIVLQRQTFGNNSNRRINGQTWAVQGWEFEVFPRYPGTYEIPGVEVSVEVADGSGGSIRGETVTEPLTLEAIAPPVEPPAEAWVVSPDLSIRTTWDLPREDMMAGDARQRTITITAEELPSMVLPAPTYEEIDGIGIYPQPARRDDQTNRGQSTATFTQTVSYFLESPGSYVIPGFTLAWWNPDSGAWQTAEAPSETFDVVANPNANVDTTAAEIADTPPVRTFLKRFLIISTGLFIVALIIRSVRRRLAQLSHWWAARQRAHINDEPQRWRDLQHTLRKTDSHAMVRALYRWRDTLPAQPGSPTLEALAVTIGSPELADLFNRLLQASSQASPAGFSEGPQIKPILRRARRALIRPNSRAYTLPIDNCLKRLN
jgi:hypothetical protein